MTQLPKLLTPSAQGFFMPAEWEQHLSTWLAWPHNLDTWKSDDLREVEKVYMEIIHNLITGERINILIENKSFQKRIISLLISRGLNTKQIYFHEILTNDAWIRDFGPNFIVRKSSSGRQIAINLWQFNSWGEKYPWQKDNEVSNKIISESKITYFNPKIVLEGGSIDVNGEGTCLTTSTCLLNLNRNSNLTVEKMEEYLKSYMGVKKIIWLKGTLKGDDTDGHVDNLARFVNHTTIVYVSEKDESNENYLSLKGIEKSLKKARDPNGLANILLKSNIAGNDLKRALLSMCKEIKEEQI